MLADMATEIDAARLLTLRAALMKDQGVRHSARERDGQAVRLARWPAASRNKALQIHGGTATSRSIHVERHVRDARITEIYEGTSEIQRIVIAAVAAQRRPFALEFSVVSLQLSASVFS